MDPATCGTESSAVILSNQESTTDLNITSSSSSSSDPGKVAGALISSTIAGSLPLPIGFVNVNEQHQDHIRAKFASSPGYVVPAPSFSYSVFPRSSASTSANQSTSTAPFKLTPTMPATALQPPVPGQFLGNRPFPYTVVSHANVVPATGQQFQLATAPNQSQIQGGKFAPVTNSFPLQPPVPGQSHVSSLSVHGNLVPNSIVPMNHSFSGILQTKTAETLARPLPSETASTMALTGGANVSSVDSQSTELSVNNLSVSSTSLVSSSATMPAPSFTAQPSMIGTPSFLGVTSSMKVSNSDMKLAASTALSSSRLVVSSASLSSTSVPVTMQSTILQGAQQQLHMHYLSHAGAVPPLQSMWSHPHQSGSSQRPPFLPFHGVVHLPLPIPSIPTVLMPNVHPPGVNSLVAQAAATAGSLQSSIVVEPSKAFDQDKKDAGPQNDKKDPTSEEVNAWTSHRTDAGILYYYNSITGESTYEKPANFKFENNVTTQTTPVSWEKIDGTDWTLVTTNDGRKYYYDSKNKISSWHAPVEVLELKKQEKASTKGNSNQLTNGTALADNLLASVSGGTPLQTAGRDSTALKTCAVPVPSSALDLIKKKLQEAGSPVTSSPIPTAGSTSDVNGSKATENAVKIPQSASEKDRMKDATGDGNLSDSSSDTDDDDCGPSKEECFIQFKEMLKERGVAPFSKWEKELPKIVFDPRFKAVPSHSVRRTLFEHYVRTRVEEERKEKRAAQKAAIDSFKQLLEEASDDIDHKTDYHTFKRKWGGDPRFKAVDHKEGELLLNEKVKACEEKIRALRFAAESSFKFMLKEHTDITTSSRWSKVKDSLRHDTRYKAVKHEDRETLFNEYISEQRAAEEEVLRAMHSKRDEQDKLKEREREMRKRKEREEEEMEKVKLKVRRKEAESLFRALLVETIKDPKASWTESKPKLDKDPQGRATNSDLPQKDAEKLFREHVKDLYERCVDDFRAMLAEMITPEVAQTKDDGKTALTSWSEAKRLLKPDLRYVKLPSKDRESLWHRFADDMMRKLKSESHPKEKSSDSKIRNSIDFSRKSPRRSGIK